MWKLRWLQLRLRERSRCRSQLGLKVVSLVECAALTLVFVSVISPALTVANRGCTTCGIDGVALRRKGPIPRDVDVGDYQSRIHFPDDDVAEELGGRAANGQIPLSMMMRLSSVSNASQLFDEFILQPPVLLTRLDGTAHKSAALVSRGQEASYFYEVDEGRSKSEVRELKRRSLSSPLKSIEAASVPKPALCQPELQTVKLKASDDPSLFYFPSCTRIERCGGCCSHDLLSCQPISTEPISYQVVVTQFVGGNQLQYKGKEVITVEKHTKCKCDCTIKASDCNQHQIYEKSECRCKCANVEKQKLCENESTIKLWDPKSCSCQCREVQECSTGLIWDHVRCSCVVTPRSTKNRAGPDPQDRTRYRLGAERI